MKDELSPIQKLQAAIESGTSQISELTAELATAKASIETLTAQATESAAALASEQAARAEEKAAADKAITDAAAKLEAEATARKEAETAHEATKGALANAQKALANPAFADAAVRGVAPVGDAGGNPCKNEMTFAEFKQLSHSERMAFAVRGGKFTD